MGKRQHLSSPFPPGTPGLHVAVAQQYGQCCGMPNNDNESDGGGVYSSVLQSRCATDNASNNGPGFPPRRTPWPYGAGGRENNRKHCPVA